MKKMQKELLLKLQYGLVFIVKKNFFATQGLYLRVSNFCSPKRHKNLGDTSGSQCKTMLWSRQQLSEKTCTLSG